MDKIEQVKKILDKAYPNKLSNWCPDPPTLAEPDRPLDCPTDCNLCIARLICALEQKPDIEGILQKYSDGKISTERLAEKLGVNYYVLHNALRQGHQLFEQKPADEKELREWVAQELRINFAFDSSFILDDFLVVADDILAYVRPIIEAGARKKERERILGTIESGLTPMYGHWNEHTPENVTYYQLDREVWQALKKEV